jgi:hypothetical protein
MRNFIVFSNEHLFGIRSAFRDILPPSSDHNSQNHPDNEQNYRAEEQRNVQGAVDCTEPEKHEQNKHHADADKAIDGKRSL